MGNAFTGLLAILFCLNAIGQEGTQVIRGTVRDQLTLAPLPFSGVVLFKDSVFLGGVYADSIGRFRFNGVTPGRYSLKCTYLGYEPFYLRVIEVSSGKETVLDLKMEDGANEIEAAVVTGVRKDETINEMAAGSVRVFSADEAARYAGSRSDIARMASNFAGVQGSDDSRNDLVIRGNSPFGVLWRVDDVDIPNPNHFSASGTSGGPVSALNASLFSASDFMTGAFSAEYGNATAGVFDLKFRPGNNEKHEFYGQIGFLGLELGAEGPLQKNKAPAASYLLSYRYSTLAIFEKLKVPIGTSAVPNYQDGALKISIPGKGGKSNLSIFGIGGKSNIDIIQSKYTSPEENLYEDSNRDEYFGSSFAVGGISYSRTVGKNSYFKTVFSASTEESHSFHQLIFRDSGYSVDSLVEKLRYKFVTRKYSLNSSVTTKFSHRFNIKAGCFADLYQFDFLDSIYLENTFLWVKRIDVLEDALLLRPYIQGKYRIFKNLTATAGIHGLFFTLNQTWSIEPRGGLKWNFKQGQSLGIAFGFHSRILPSYLYLIQYDVSGTEPAMLNKDLDLMRAKHLVFSYDLTLSQNSRLKAEAYYQWLNKVAVNRFPSSYSMLNEGTSFDRIFPLALESNGKGRNYGLELTLERFFSEQYFFLFSGSLYNSLYTPSDGEERSTDFNGNFAVNAVGGREFVFGKKKNKFLLSDIKITYAGGGRYTPPDLAASNAAGTLVEVDSLRNSQTFRNYFRTDIKFGIKLNSKRKISHEIAIDLVNVFNTKNILELSFAPNPLDPSANPLQEIYQLGRLPLFYYRVDF